MHPYGAQGQPWTAQIRYVCIYSTCSTQLPVSFVLTYDFSTALYVYTCLLDPSTSHYVPFIGTVKYRTCMPM